MESTTTRFLKKIKELIENKKSDIVNTRFKNLEEFNFQQGKLIAYEDALTVMREIIISEHGDNNNEEDDV